MAFPRVVFVAGWYPTDDEPVAGIFVRRHAIAASRVARLVVVHPYADDVGRPRLTDVPGEPVPTLRARYLRSSGRVRSELRQLLVGVAAARACARRLGGADLLHVNILPSAGLWLGLRIALPRTPVVVTEHWSGFLPESRTPLSRARRALVRRQVRAAEVVTTPSEHLRRSMQRLGFAGRYRLVPNVVDTELFRPGPPPPARPLRLLHVSTLRPLKNVRGIVEAVLAVRAVGIEAVLDVWGWGDDGPALLEWVQSRAPADVVRMHGAGAPERIAEAYRACHALVLFSDYENAPCVVSEAMASGRPVIATRVGGIPESVTRDRGLLVSPGDGTALVEAIQSCACGRFQLDPEATRDFAVARFGEDAVSMQLADVYQAALSRRSCVE